MEIPAGLYKVILENVNDAIYFVDRERRIVFWNNAAEKLTGFKKEEVIGKKCSDNVLQHVDEKGNNLCLSACPLTYAMKYDSNTETNVFLHHKNGERIPVKVKATPIKNYKGDIVGAVEIFFENSYVIAMKERLKYYEEAALVDPLTKLSNRRYVEETIISKIFETKRYNRLFAILYIDLDNFKEINDRFGHEVGDNVLKMVANTIRNNVRFFDVVGRMGGDEFVIIVEVTKKEALSSMATKILSLLQKSFLEVQGEKISVNASIGCYIIKGDDTLKTALNRADKLMYVSKKEGKGKITLESGSL